MAINMEVLEEEVEIYNSKMRLLTWLYEELKLYPESTRDIIHAKGHDLPINV